MEDEGETIDWAWAPADVVDRAVVDEDTAFCADGCGRVATTERLDSMYFDEDDDLVEVVELVCRWCKDAEGIADG